jgi:hypothetical protein
MKIEETYALVTHGFLDDLPARWHKATGKDPEYQLHCFLRLKNIWQFCLITATLVLIAVIFAGIKPDTSVYTHIGTNRLKFLLGFVASMLLVRYPVIWLLQIPLCRFHRDFKDLLHVLGYDCFLVSKHHTLKDLFSLKEFQRGAHERLKEASMISATCMEQSGPGSREARYWHKRYQFMKTTVSLFDLVSTPLP